MTATTPTTQPSIDSSGTLPATFKGRSEWLWSAWELATGESSDKESPKQSAVRRIVERDKDDSKSAAAIGVTLAAFVIAISTFALKSAAAEWLAVSIIAAGLVVLALLILVFMAQRRVVVSSNLLTKMDLSLASGNAEDKPVTFLRLLTRPFVG